MPTLSQAVLGAAHAKAILHRLIEEDTGVHAVLLYGVDGAGMEPLGAALAQSWLCQSGGCGACGICHAAQAGRAVDLLHIRPAGPSALIRVNTISASRGQGGEDSETVPVEEFLRTGPLMARHKVVRIDRAERMLTGAANALLKTLEEPPPSAKLILTTSEFARVLPTIRSRCLCVACELPTPDELVAAFPDATPIEKLMGEGSPGGLERVFASRETYAKLDALLAHMRELPQGAALMVSERFKALADELAKGADANTRAGQTEALRALGCWVARYRPRATPAVAEAHRLIRDNANPGVVLDALFARIMEPGMAPLPVQ